MKFANQYCSKLENCMNPLEIIRNSRFFDRNYYYETYKDVEITSMSCEEHYLTIGYLEGRNPSLSFSTLDYFKSYGDILHKKVNPLVHYESCGKKENRKVIPVSLLPGPEELISYKVCFFSIVIYLSDYVLPSDIRTVLNSVYAQSYSNFEIILVDNGITTYSFNVILEFIEKYSNIKIICRKELNKDVNFSNKLLFGSSIKAALDICSGRYVVFLNGSDFWDKNHLLYLNSSIHANPKTELILNNINLIGNVENLLPLYELSQSFNEAIKNDENLFVNLFDKIKYHFSCFCCRKDIFLSIDLERINSMRNLFISVCNNLSDPAYVSYLNYLKSFVKLNSSFQFLSNYYEYVDDDSDDVQAYPIDYLIDQKFLKFEEKKIEVNKYIAKTDDSNRDLAILAEFFYKKRAYKYSIKVLDYIYDTLNFKRNNLLFRKFDCYNALKDFTDAERILQSVHPLNLIEENKLQTRKDILSSSKATRMDVKFEKIQLDDCLLANIGKHTSFSYCRADVLAKQQLLLTNYLPHFSCFVIDYVDHSRHYALPVAMSNGYVLDLNLLTANRVGIILDDKSVQWLFSISKKTILGVLRGLDNWLFLDNDSNKSSDQYTGKMLISDNEISNWNTYFHKVASNISNFLLLIPPSKEAVFPEYYPHKRAKFCPIDQFESLIEKFPINYLYPLNLLKRDKTSYVKTETHWSYKAGANIFFSILERLNIEHEKFVLPYTFSARNWVGDLGSKCNPQEFSDNYYVIDNLTIYADVIFTNLTFQNKQGKITKYHNNSAYCKKKIVVFGDSFNNVLVPFFTSFFSDVIIVWSNATIINDVLRYENPDYVIAEITERFIIRAPAVLDGFIEYKPCIRTDLSTQDLDYVLNLRIDSDLVLYKKYIQDYKAVLKY